MTQYETVAGGGFLAPHYSERERVAYRVLYEAIHGNYRRPVETTSTTMAMAWARANGWTDMAKTIFKTKRAWRLSYDTMTQRQWQAHSRRPSRARHHDSIALREKYVRVQP